MKKSTHTADYAQLRRELRDIRQKSHHSQRDLASMLGVPHSWVAKVENGERRIDLIEFFEFVTACGEAPLDAVKRLLRESRRFQLTRGRGGSHRDDRTI